MPAPNGKTPRANGPGWLTPLYVWLDALLSLLLGGAGTMWQVDMATRVPLPTVPVYANGTSGVGATLTAGSNAAFPTRNGVVPFVGMLVLIAGEATQANNGYYQLTTVGSSSVKWVLTRMTGWDQSAEISPGSAFTVRVRLVSGAVGDSLYAGFVFIYTGAPLPTVGTTALTFVPNPRRTVHRGVIPSNRLVASVKPTANDVFAIGAITFKWVAALGVPIAQVQLLIGATAATAYQAAVDAINGNAAQSGVTWLEASTPFAQPIVADMVTATVLRTLLADVRGGVAVPGVSASLAMTASVSGGASAWENTNLNATGKDPSDALESYGQLTVTTALIAGTTSHIELPFAPAVMPLMMGYTAAGVPRWFTDTITISGSTIVVTYGGGASPNLQNTDKLVFLARS